MRCLSLMRARVSAVRASSLASSVAVSVVVDLAPVASEEEGEASAPAAPGVGPTPPGRGVGKLGSGACLPPRASKTGKRYYAFRGSEAGLGRPPFVACGSDVAVAWLGGSWVGHGLGPTSFAELEDAINACLAFRRGSSVVVETSVRDGL